EVEHVGAFHRGMDEVLVGRIEGVIDLEGLGVRVQGAVDIHVVLEIARPARVASDIRVLSIQADCVPLERATHATITLTVNTVAVVYAHHTRGGIAHHTFDSAAVGACEVTGYPIGAETVYTRAVCAGEAAASAAGGYTAHTVAAGADPRYASVAVSYYAEASA